MLEGGDGTVGVGEGGQEMSEDFGRWLWHGFWRQPGWHAPRQQAPCGSCIGPGQSV